MKIGIIGAGFTGLSAAYRLAQKGHKVTIIEKDSEPGGLAIGYKEKKWKWSLEKHYHHWFTNDNSVLNLAKEINHQVIIRTPLTNWYVNGKIYQFVSLKAALTFPLLTFTERLRQLLALGLLRVNPFWKPLEKFKTNDVMPKLMGEKVYSLLWKTILINKFGKYADEISLAWFWARIKKRTQSLAYPQGGFLDFANHLAKEVKKMDTNILFATETLKIYKHDDGICIRIKKGKKEQELLFDKVIVTLSAGMLAKLTPQLPKDYLDKISILKSLGASNLVLRLKERFFKDNTYWLSIADTSSPIMAIVEHTNYMDKEYYDNDHLVYLGNYLDINDPKYSKTAEELLSLYDPFLKKINSNYKTNIIGYSLFKAPFAQPIIPTNYSKNILPLQTPIKGLYIANMQQVYPWDRGTNYAVELGEKVANLITNDK